MVQDLVTLYNMPTKVRASLLQIHANGNLLQIRINGSCHDMKIMGTFFCKMYIWSESITCWQMSVASQPAVRTARVELPDVHVADKIAWH